MDISSWKKFNPNFISCRVCLSGSIGYMDYPLGQLSVWHLTDDQRYVTPSEGTSTNAHTVDTRIITAYRVKTCL